METAGGISLIYGRLQSLDWTGGLDRWTGLDWTGMDWTGLDSTQLKVSATILQLLESGYLLSTYLCNFTQSCILLPSMEHACSKVQSYISK